MTDAQYDGGHDRLSDDDAEEVNSRLLDMLDADMALDHIETTMEDNPAASATPQQVAAVMRSAPAEVVPVVDDVPVKPVRKPRPIIVGGFKERAGYAARVVGFHLLRSPLYLAVGVKVAAVKAKNWIGRGKGRGKLLRLAVVASPFLAVWVWSEHGRWGTVPAAVLAGTVLVFVVTGFRVHRVTLPDRSQDPVDVSPGAGSAVEVRPVVVTAPMPDGEPVQPKFGLFNARPKGPEVSNDEDQEIPPLVLRALAMSGFGSLHGARSEIKRDSAQRVQGGVEMVVKMAPGLETEKLIKEHGRFASAMGMPAERVVIETLPTTSPGAFGLFIADELLSQMQSPAWEWSDVRRRSYFDEVPIGIDSRCGVVTVPLFETNGTVSGDVGMGKSATARLLVLGALMDPRTRVIIHNFKGGMDYKAFAPVAHKLRNGCDKEDLESFLETLAWLRSEVARRNKVLESLSFAECPDSKLTDALANREDLRPVFVLLDELPRVFLSKVSDQAEEGILDVVQTARSVGITVRLVFQGAKEGTVPARILDRCKHRIGHGVNSVADANQALGEGAHGRGYRAVEIDTPGVAYVGIAGGSMVKTKLSYLDMPTVHGIVQEIEVMRREAGTLSGMAAGEIPADDDDGTGSLFLDDVMEVWPVEGNVIRPTVALAEVADLLMSYDRDSWPDLDATQVGRLFREAGVTPSSVRVSTDPKPVKGVKRADVVQARGR